MAAEAITLEVVARTHDGTAPVEVPLHVFLNLSREEHAEIVKDFRRAPELKKAAIELYQNLVDTEADRNPETGEKYKDILALEEALGLEETCL